MVIKDPVQCKLEIENSYNALVMDFQYLQINVSTDWNTYEKNDNGSSYIGYLRDAIRKINRFKSKVTKLLIGNRNVTYKKVRCKRTQNNEWHNTSVE